MALPVAVDSSIHVSFVPDALAPPKRLLAHDRAGRLVVHYLAGAAARTMLGLILTRETKDDRL